MRGDWIGPPRLYGICARQGRWGLLPLALPDGNWEAAPTGGQPAAAAIAGAAAAKAARPGYRPLPWLHGIALSFEDQAPGAGDGGGYPPAGARARLIQGTDLDGTGYGAVYVMGTDMALASVIGPEAPRAAPGSVRHALASALADLAGQRKPPPGLSQDPEPGR